MDKAAAYIRVSTQEQAMHGLSLDAQKMKLQEFADSNNIAIVEWYADEGVSGRKLISKRPELQRMIADAQKGRFGRILFIKLDRFFRSVAEYHKCMDMLNGIPWTATEEKYDLTSANGRMFVNMKLTVAELEADQTGERIKMVYDYKAKAGIPMTGTRLLPFCYENPKTDGKRKIIKRNAEAMMDMIEHFEQHQSIRGAMNYINEKHGLNLVYNSVYSVLKNPLICGEYRGNTAYCEPYITRERFNRLQEMVKRNRRTTDKHTYIFQSLVRCPVCGGRLSGSAMITKKACGRYSYKSYRCSSQLTNSRCSFTLAVFESRLESAMLDFIDSDLKSYSISGSIAENAEAEVIDTSKLKAELSRINYAWEKGRLTPEEYDRKYEDVNRRIREAEEKKSSTQKPKAMDLPENWRDIYSDLSEEGKQTFWHSIVSKIEIEWNPGRNSEKKIVNIEYV